MSNLSLKELEKHTCESFGGNNCVLHGCMFFCQLEDAKKKAKEKESNNSLSELGKYKYTSFINIYKI